MWFIFVMVFYVCLLILANAEKYRSMYDEPRRKAAVQSKEKLSAQQPKVRKPRSQKEPTKKPRRTAAPKIVETESESEEDSGTESASENEENITHEEETSNNKTVAGHIYRKETKETLDTKKENESNESKNAVEEQPSEEELLNNLILLEHNYFLPRAPSPSVDTKKNNKKEPSPKADKILREILVDNDRNLQPKLKRHRKDSIKGELKYKFQMRTKEQEKDIIWDIYNGNLDTEDLRYMKEAFESLKQVGSKDIASFTWADLERIFSLQFICMFIITASPILYTIFAINFNWCTHALGMETKDLRLLVHLLAEYHNSFLNSHLLMQIRVFKKC